MGQIRINHNTLSPYIQQNKIAIKFKYVTYEHFVIELQQTNSNQKIDDLSQIIIFHNT